MNTAALAHVILMHGVRLLGVLTAATHTHTHTLSIFLLGVQPLCTSSHLLLLSPVNVTE